MWKIFIYSKLHWIVDYIALIWKIIRMQLYTILYYSSSKEQFSTKYMI